MATLVTINEETKTISEWCKIYGIKPNTARYRIRALKHNVEDAITKPVRKKISSVKNKRLYHIWVNMIGRCYKKTRADYKYYGMRNISVCNDWKNNFLCFQDWALNNGYDDFLTLDRIDNNGNYSPENCKWSTQREQRLNNSQILNVTISGKTKCLKDWCKDLNLNYNMVYMRYKRGKTLKEALNA